MDILMLVIGLVFLGLVGAGLYVAIHDPSFFGLTRKDAAAPKSKQDPKKPMVDPLADLQKKFNTTEERMKEYQTRIENLQYDLEQAKKQEKALRNEKSTSAFDSQQYEKFKKEFKQQQTLLSAKEEILEKEISQRRQLAAELAGARQENDELKKRTMEAEDATRKAQSMLETTAKELDQLKRAVREQKKIVQEHATQKSEGEWVSREEFNKVEQELAEKEAMIKKLLALTPPGATPPPPDANTSTP
jgi:chromosome segregation ATPase